MSAGRRLFRHLRERASAVALLAAAAVATTFLLGGCTAHTAEPVAVAVDAAGKTELILEPVDVWGVDGTTASGTGTIDGKDFAFVHRPADSSEPAWVRLGLFWQSPMQHIIMPVVVLGPPAEIHALYLRTNSGREFLTRAENFHFTPAQRTFDRSLSSAAYTLTPSQLSLLIDHPQIIIGVRTNRGVLHVSPAVVSEMGESAWRNSARYHFALFRNAHQAAQ